MRYYIPDLKILKDMMAEFNAKTGKCVTHIDVSRSMCHLFNVDGKTMSQFNQARIDIIDDELSRHFIRLSSIDGTSITNYIGVSG